MPNIVPQVFQMPSKRIPKTLFIVYNENFQFHHCTFGSGIKREAPTVDALNIMTYQKGNVSVYCPRAPLIVLPTLELRLLQALPEQCFRLHPEPRQAHRY